MPSVVGSCQHEANKDHSRHSSGDHMYQIKEEREKQRELKRLNERMAMLGDIEGLSEEEIAERLAEAEFETAAQGTAQKQNAMAVLISVGAQFTQKLSADSGEAVAIQERRRVQRKTGAFFECRFSKIFWKFVYFLCRLCLHPKELNL